MGSSSRKVKQPPDPDLPDPAPIAAGADTAAEQQSASRQERKKAAAANGRAKTVLAGNTATDNAAKKTVLG